MEDPPLQHLLGWCWRNISSTSGPKEVCENFPGRRFEGGQAAARGPQLHVFAPRLTLWAPSCVRSHPRKATTSTRLMNTIPPKQEGSNYLIYPILSPDPAVANDSFIIASVSWKWSEQDGMASAVGGSTAAARVRIREISPSLGKDQKYVQNYPVDDFDAEAGNTK